MPVFKDLTNKSFGKWTAIERTDDRVLPSGNKITTWKCKCECGVIKNVTANSLLSGRSKSCGCDKSKVAKLCGDTFRIHGETKTRLYRIWAGMRKRCNNKASDNYELYGGRGISVCPEWDDYSVFRNWSFSNGYRDDLSIDRINVNGDYSPENCRWADRVTQNNNRRSNVNLTYNRETHTIAEWSRILNIPYKLLHKKLHRGVSLEEIISAFSQTQ